MAARDDGEDATERERWRRAARERPREIAPAGPGQESVWDYPRPPRVEPVSRSVRVEFGGVVVAESRRAVRVCETSSPPAYYVPREDVLVRHLEPGDDATLCEWKGRARHWSLRVGERFSRNAAWSYPDPDPAFAALRDRLAFYAGRVDACFLGGCRVEPQPGAYYGGWITPEVRGPFKGEPGSERW